MTVTEAEQVKLYRPYDTLKAIGFTTEEAKSFLICIENEFTSKSSNVSISVPDKVVRYRVQRSELRRSRLRSLLLVAWGYAFAIWLYVIGMQLLYPKSIYWLLATWVPIRLDYLGETAFVFSFFVAIAITMWNTKLSSRAGRHHSESKVPPSA
jgi:hypothetical protein